MKQWRQQPKLRTLLTYLRATRRRSPPLETKPRWYGGVDGSSPSAHVTLSFGSTCTRCTTHRVWSPRSEASKQRASAATTCCMGAGALHEGPAHKLERRLR